MRQRLSPRETMAVLTSGITIAPDRRAASGPAEATCEATEGSGRAGPVDGAEEAAVADCGAAAVEEGSGTAPGAEARRGRRGDGRVCRSAATER